jgi:hypothetical protein
MSKILLANLVVSMLAAPPLKLKIG